MMNSSNTKEQMFEKPLTPSDVGKLNRLVIPKQHAEKYFPLGRVDSASEKGFLLSFEDESGKPWRFRYSYWTSSQSYVLTKGWSRFVKENRLDAGDVVSFDRLRFDTDKFFIRCRRRSATTTTTTTSPHVLAHVPPSSSVEPAHPPLWAHAHAHAHAHALYHAHHLNNNNNGYPSYYSPPAFHHQPQQCYVDDLGRGVVGGEANAGVSSNKGGSSMRSVRLFGVNLECEMEAEDDDDDDDVDEVVELGPQDGSDCSGLSAQQGPAHLVFSQPHGPTHYTHMRCGPGGRVAVEATCRVLRWLDWEGKPNSKGRVRSDTDLEMVASAYNGVLKLKDSDKSSDDSKRIGWD
ncbi:hypothetical protein Scep_015132 [Stephania cephalantha]|uniref:TF-B3 domain-containing protein n=1 Tax=Stephania cephalantha TaxID=152367 RepID=A0AAP0J570_9MAGN